MVLSQNGWEWWNSVEIVIVNRKGSKLKQSGMRINYKQVCCNVNYLFIMF